MERLIWIAILLGIAAAVFAALYFIQKRRIERLAARIEDFLVTGKNALEYSVREDSIAPVHNAAAELENRISAKIKELETASNKPEIINELNSLLNERNRKCKLFK